MSHSQFHCTGRVYLDLHGLIFETSICYWQDQPGSRTVRGRGRGVACRGRRGGRPTSSSSPPSAAGGGAGAPSRSAERAGGRVGGERVGRSIRLSPPSSRRRRPAGRGGPKRSVCFRFPVRSRPLPGGSGAGTRRVRPRQGSRNAVLAGGTAALRPRRRPASAGRACAGRVGDGLPRRAAVADGASRSRFGAVGLGRSAAGPGGGGGGGGASAPNHPPTLRLRPCAVKETPGHVVANPRAGGTARPPGSGGPPMVGHVCQSVGWDGWMDGWMDGWPW